MTNQHVKTALLAAFTLLAAQVADAQDAEIHILCSNGFRAAMEKLLPQAEHAAGRPVKVEFGASANFKRSIEGGAPFDLAIVTPQIVEDLIKEGKIAAGTKVDLASTGIGIAVRAGRPKPDVSSAQAVKQMLLGAKSVGYVKVGAGTPAIVDMLNSLILFPPDDTASTLKGESPATPGYPQIGHGAIALSTLFNLPSDPE